jgi:hypothetical protein
MQNRGSSLKLESFQACIHGEHGAVPGARSYCCCLGAPRGDVGVRRLWRPNVLVGFVLICLRWVSAHVFSILFHDTTLHAGHCLTDREQQLQHTHTQHVNPCAALHAGEHHLHMQQRITSAFLYVTHDPPSHSARLAPWARSCAPAN